MISKGSGYVKGASAGGRLVAHFKYMEHRSRDPEKETREDRRIFSKDEDSVSRSEAVNDVMNHEHPHVAYHKIVLSPAENEPVEDWREWTRQLMGDLEDHKGMDLTWYAVKHDNTDNPHVHVVLAGRGEDRESGELGVVKMFQPDYQILNHSGHDHSEHDWYRDMGEMMQDFDKQDAQELGAREPERGLDRDSFHDIDFDIGP